LTLCNGFGVWGDLDISYVSISHMVWHYVWHYEKNYHFSGFWYFFKRIKLNESRSTEFYEKISKYDILLIFGCIFDRKWHRKNMRFLIFRFLMDFPIFSWCLILFLIFPIFSYSFQFLSQFWLHILISCIWYCSLNIKVLSVRL